MICEICGKNFNHLSKHVRTHNYSCKDYYDKFLKKDDEGFCKECGKETTFATMDKGYRIYCSNKCCVNNDEWKKKYQQTNLERHGSRSAFGSKKVQKKSKQTIMNRYGVENVLQNSEIKNKSKQTNLERYGVENPSKNTNVKNKTKKTNLERYGKEYLFQVDSVKKKSYETWKRKYNGYPLQNEEIRKKGKETLLERYGVDHPLKTKIFREKSKQTMINRYGDHNMRVPILKDKVLYSHKKRMIDKMLHTDRLKDIVTPLFNIDEYINCHQILKWKCNLCGNVFEDDINNGKIPRCLECFPLLNGASRGEMEVFEYCQKFVQCEHKCRNIINGEIDVYIPNKNLAIEFNGLYWHSEQLGKDKHYHLNKTEQCKDNGIKLLHIFEDEWYNKQFIVKSIIKNKLGLINNKIPARKCIVKKIDKDYARDFLIKNHLQGPTNGIHYGLIYDNTIVCILTIGKPRYNKNFQYEILRFCTKINTIVNGGFSKLFNHFTKDYNPKTIITYVDRRFGNGDFYRKFGFEYYSQSDPNYFYLNDYFERHSRIKFQKHKLESLLETFDPQLTEWENMQINGWDRIWDCGNYVFKYEQKSKVI